MWYAQHGEDEKLFTLIGEKTNGFYIDIGAWHPQVDSVTKHFYDKGWHGVNIEPVPSLIEPFLLERPRDINLNIAVSSSSGERVFFCAKDTGLSTLDSQRGKDIEKMYNAERILVPTNTLKQICDTYLDPGQEIDFLKIDVENHEEAIILHADWEKWRPAYLCIEATYPCTDTPNWHNWFPYLTKCGYDLLEFDGLNMWFHDSHKNS